MEHTKRLEQQPIRVLIEHTNKRWRETADEKGRCADEQKGLREADTPETWASEALDPGFVLAIQPRT